MTSTPNQNLLVTPARRHRHKRSAAISGDFDVMGLGLFQPPSLQKSTSANACGDEVTALPDTDQHYVFNNEEDFKGGADFSFPMKTPDLAKAPRKPTFPGPANNTLSPRKILHSSSYSLHSPIRINQHKRSATVNHSKSRFFEDSNSDVPEAVIDLDEILNANLHIGSYSRNSSLGSLHPEFEEDFLASPFAKSAPSSPFFLPVQHSSAPSSLGANNLLFSQPIQESADLIEEEEERRCDEEEETHVESRLDDVKRPFDYKEVALPFSLASIYALSANSSCSSIRSVKIPAIEKTFSNSSKESGASLQATNVVIGTSASTSKRSGAKANRYQSFYDQSSRISNAMKISSSESVNIIRSNSSGANIPHTGIPKDRSLGHSSSLPSLKANKHRLISLNNRQRISEVRLEKRSSKETLFVRPGEGASPRLDPVKSQEKIEHAAALTPTTTHASTLPTKPGHLSTSPISVHSDISSAVISSNETIQSTDHSSLASQHDISAKGRKPVGISIDRSANSTPAIVVNGAAYGGELSPSTNSTFRQDEDEKPAPSFNESTFIKHGDGAESDLTSSSSKPVLVIENVLSLSSSVSSLTKSPTKRSPRRPMTPAEEKILKLTKIPTFKVSPTPSLASPVEGRKSLSSTAPPHSLGSPTDARQSVKLPSSELTSTFPPLSKSKSSLGPDQVVRDMFSPKFFSKDKLDSGSLNPFQDDDRTTPMLKSRRRYSAFSLFGRDEPGRERRGSASFSIASQPVNTESKSSLSASRILRHGKHFSMSSDIGFKFRAPKEETSLVKRSRFIDWFKKK